MNGSEDSIRVALLASNQAMRIGLRTLLANDPGVEIRGAENSLPGLDPMLPEVDVIVAAQPRSSLIADLHELLPEDVPYPALLILSDEPPGLQNLLNEPFRAIGLLSENASLSEISAALRALNEGLTVTLPDLLSAMLPEPLVGRSPVVASEDDFLLVDRLTPRELEILQLLAYGLPNKQIAQNLIISEHTVKFHISSIYSKLGASNRTEAVRAGARAGLIVL